ncbi:MAG: DUF2092 domain-containing protein [Pseudoxanthomonas sp.]
MKKPIRHLKHASGLLLAAAMAPSLSAQTSQAASSANSSAIDAAAIAALDQMGAKLRSLKQFTLTSDTSIDVVLDSGQKVELDGQLTYKVSQPNRLFVELVSDRRLRQLIYDGRTLVVFAPRLGYYAEVDDVGSSIKELLASASENYDVELPLADLFAWGTADSAKQSVLSAIAVGPALIKGEQTDQYAFRQQGVDWQIWISRSSRLPLKLQIVSLDDPALPQYEAALKWDTTTTLPDKTFTFVPPEGSGRIALKPADREVASER